MSDRRAEEMLGVAAIATAAFALTALATATRRSAHLDRQAARRLKLRPRSRRRRVADRLSPAGKWYVVIPASAAAGAVAARANGRTASGAAIVASAVVAAALSKAFDRLLPQPPVPPGHRREPRKAVFPSGHGLIASAASLTTAYVFVREGVAHPLAAAPAAAAFSIANPALKVGVEKHWATDALGGVAGGVAVAAVCCAAYELSRE